MRKLLKLDVASEEVKPLHVVAAERAERISSLEAELKEQHAAAKHVQDAWRKAAGRLKKTHGTVTQARREATPASTVVRRQPSIRLSLASALRCCGPTPMRTRGSAF